MGRAAGTAASPGSRDGYPTGAAGAKKVGWASSPVSVWAAGTAASPGSRDGSFAGQPRRQLRWAAGTAASPGSRDGNFAGQPRTAASLGSRARRLRWAAEDGYPTAAVGAEKVGWASSPVRCSGNCGRQLRWAAGTATLLLAAETATLLLLPSERRKWDGRPRLSVLLAGDGSFAGQPRTAASLGSRDGYPTGGGRDGGFAGQPRTATLLSGQGDLHIPAVPAGG